MAQDLGLVKFDKSIGEKKHIAFRQKAVTLSTILTM
jgi:hypothetical protein